MPAKIDLKNSTDPDGIDSIVETVKYDYEINGQKTTVKMPKPWNYNSKNTDHVMNSDGTLSSKTGYGGTAFKNRAPEEFINDQELPFKVENGKYYIGTTWWCYTQVWEGRICSNGGNRNSIGIESCVNEGSDLWYTWQKTAQLVADIMFRHNMDITQVKGHHFFSAKNCPQPFLERELKLWWEFIDLVEAEYQKILIANKYEFNLIESSEFIDNKGRVIKQNKYPTLITYKVEIKNNDKTVVMNKNIFFIFLSCIILSTNYTFPFLKTYKTL